MAGPHFASLEAAFPAPGLTEISSEFNLIRSEAHSWPDSRLSISGIFDMLPNDSLPVIRIHLSGNHHFDSVPYNFH